MKLGRQHLIGSLVLLAASIVYNVWVFTRPAPARTGAAAPPPATAPAAASANAPSAALDPAQVQDVPDVALDRLPVWTRNPFEHPRLQRPIVEVVASEAPPPAAVPPSDPEIASILHSADRRLALVDGRIVRIGDTLAGARVVDILPNAVVLESAARGRRTLTMKPPGSPAKAP